mgnify:FL=1
MHEVVPCIWYQGNAEEAMNFYVSLFPNSKIKEIQRYAGGQGIPGEKELEGKVLTGVFELNGQKFMCLDGGPQFKLEGGAISFLIEFDTQEELDRVWDKLLDGGTPQQCGWITDKFGVTWQITPTNLGKYLSDPDATPAQKKAVLEAMMPMVKMEAAKFDEAFNNAK